MNKNRFELLAPGGDIDSIKAAIVAGADAIYCGLDRFNARNRAENLTLDNLNEVITLAHSRDCKIFLTLNIIILESEIPAVTRLLRQLVHFQIDGVIIQDLGLAYILKHHFPELDVHASTQLNTHNEGQLLFMKQLGVSRVNLSRELNISEIKRLAQFGLQHEVLTEVFVHGSYCIGFSGLCYISSARNGASGNRGRCSQPCRDQYQTTDMGSDYPLNMKDNSAFLDLDVLADAGVYSLKVEGRIKKSHYVYTVIDNWRKQIDAFSTGRVLSTDRSELYTVFNRDFSDGYLQGDISRDMFINNPRDHAATYFTQLKGVSKLADIQQVKKELYDKKTEIIRLVATKTQGLLSLSNKSRVTSLKGGGVGDIPALHAHSPMEQQARLAVLISSMEDVYLEENAQVDLYYQMPDSLASSLDALITFFSNHPRVIPYFPAILIDSDFDAVEIFLERVKPHCVVANNTGVGYLAARNSIKWMAGPQLNITNSYAIQCLHEEFNCGGAFISNELNRIQIQKIARPANFKLFYSIFHPNNLLTSRQCLFQQSSGCKKIKIKKGCLAKCEKHTSIISLKDAPYIIDKQKGSHNSLFAQYHYYNPNIVNELANHFSDFMVDLRKIRTMTEITATDKELVAAFEALLSGAEKADIHLSTMFGDTSNSQYIKGL